MNSASALHPPLPDPAHHRRHWLGLDGAAVSLALARAAEQADSVLVVVAPDPARAWALEHELRFFLGDRLPVLVFPDWEILAYDAFSPNQEIISERLATLARLPATRRGVLVLPAATLMHRIAPRGHIEQHSLIVARGDRFPLAERRRAFTEAGYVTVETVTAPGEFAVRGSVVDLFPMGAAQPYRLDLFDDAVDTLRTFDPESQRTLDRVERVELLPGREIPLDAASIDRFRDRWHAEFDVDPRRCPLWRDVCDGLASPGIEFWLPLFFERTGTLFDYLPASATIATIGDLEAGATRFRSDVTSRYENLRHDRERPILAPDRLFLRIDELFAAIGAFGRIQVDDARRADASTVTFDTLPLPDVAIDPHAREPAAELHRFLGARAERVLFCAESPGRREVIEQTLTRAGIRVDHVPDWHSFATGTTARGLTVASLDAGFVLPGAGCCVIPEAVLHGRRIATPRRRGRGTGGADPDLVVRNLTELRAGAPVVHVEHGIGRYLGLERLNVDGQDNEYLTLEYAEGARVYVPVASLHLIQRYTGADADSAPLHRLGSDQWEKARRKAAEKVRDVAAEILAIHARRAARKGTPYPLDVTEYERFAEHFAYDETPDQRAAIDAVLADLQAAQPMDRLVCGDVGFGKTEVAMRAAFVVVHAGRQVAVLVPTTLLAQQHFDSFRDRFADWPVRVELVSRMRTPAEVADVTRRLAEGKVDILIGTHALLARGVKFSDLGLVIIDEEHRFGVRHKERLKELRAEVDILTMTATPIPRTLNMALSSIRDMSVIATPPARRLAIRTFIRQRSKGLVREAISRELLRGGQVFYVHNEVRTIAAAAQELAELVPEARIAVGHGQMHKRELEKVMSDFHHRHANVLVCSTIIETGIDVPNANTILIERADQFGLAQLHQLRGRVGRSHRQAYAYLLTPHPKAMTGDAIKRLEAIEASGELGAGFSLATHDLEIRGAGELLGDEQSGQIESVGFSMYMDMLDRAVRAIRAGRLPDLDEPLQAGVEVNLHASALIPDDYLPDVQSRLILYKRIASAADGAALDDLLAEMTDRFGRAPEPVQNLFAVTRLKIRAERLGIVRVDFGPGGARLDFAETTRVSPIALVRKVQAAPQRYRLEGGNRLRVKLETTTLGERVNAAHGLLDELTPEAEEPARARA